jgi:hypothetical protein
MSKSIRGFLIPIILCVFCGSAFGREPLPCVAAREIIRGFVPGYTNVGDVQPSSLARVDKCLAKHKVCVLLQNDKLISAERPSQIHINSKSVVLGLVQTHHSGTRAYCTLGALVDQEGHEDIWLYATFTPNGRVFPVETPNRPGEPVPRMNCSISSSSIFSHFGRNWRPRRRREGFKLLNTATNRGKNPNVKLRQTVEMRCPPLLAPFLRLRRH